LYKPAKRKYLESLAENRIELDETKILVESLSAVVDTLTEKAKRDADTIEAMDKEIKMLRALMEQERKRSKEC